MIPTAEDADHLEYDVGGGCKYTITKEDPPVVTLTVDYGHPAQGAHQQTWAALKELFDAAPEI